MAFTFKITNRRRYLQKVTSLFPKTRKAIEQISKKSSRVYVAMLREAIVTQYLILPKNTKQYEDWKDEHFPNSLGYAHLVGDLLRNIITYSLNKTSWVGGVDPTEMDSGGKNFSMDGPARLIIEYAYYFEYGTRFQAPRPLFSTIRDAFIEDEYQNIIKQYVPNIYRTWK